jgi:hypothetical protein
MADAVQRLSPADEHRLGDAGSLMNRQVPVDELPIANRCHAPILAGLFDSSRVAFRFA